MNKVVLITDIDTELGYNLLKQYYINGYQIVGFSNTGINEISLKDFNKEFIEIIEWQRTSPVGVKNLLMKGNIRFQRIYEAIILQTASIKDDLDEMSYLDITRHIDMWIKGHFFILKELLQYFLDHEASIITLINNIQYQDDLVVSPLGEVIDVGFHTLAKNLFRFLKERNIIINSIESRTHQYEKFSEYIYKTINERAKKTFGKYYYYHDKKSLLSTFRNN